MSTNFDNYIYSYIGGENKWTKLSDLEYELDVCGEKTIADAKYYDILKETTWHVKTMTHTKNLNAKVNKYFRGHVKGKNSLTLHLFVMLLKCGKEEYDQKKHQKMTVDHIDRNTYNNRGDNLRWSTRSEQAKNRDRGARPYNAQPLPVEIRNFKFPPYVHYVKKGENEYFKIDKTHPKLTETWCTTITDKFNNIEKYDMLISYYNKLEPDPSKHYPCSGKTREQYEYEKAYENILYEETNFVLRESMLPIDVRFEKAHDSHGFCFSLKNAGLRQERTTTSKKVSAKEKFNDMLQIHARREHQANNIITVRSDETHTNVENLT